MSAAVKQINPNADVIGKKHALAMNVSAAKSLAGVIKTNLGPKGTLKMLVSGAGTVQLTKDGNTLLSNMQIQHPTAVLIARTATAQDSVAGDGSTSNVLFTGELMKQAERYLQDGLHPRIIVEGFEAAREATLEFLDDFKMDKDDEELDRELLVSVARTSLRSKVYEQLADHLTDIVVQAVQCIHVPGKPLDLHMVEIMSMRHKASLDTRFVDGLVLDHGARHPDMKRYNTNCFILTCNISLEYEKTMVNSSFFYKDAKDRERMVAAERKFTDDKVKKIIAFKQQVCGDDDTKSFIVINQKGIDPVSLDLFVKAGIVGIRRAKRRNMERLSLACGGYPVNSADDLEPACLGYADKVYEHQLGDDKFTFVEGTKNPTSCTVLIRGPNDHTIKQIKDAVRDGLRAVKNVIEDQAVVPGAGAFEAAAHCHLERTKKKIKGRAKLGYQAFADALLVIPKTLAENAGLDATDTIIKLLETVQDGKTIAGVDLETGNALDPVKQGIWDNYRVKRQFIHLGSLIATKLLSVDEVMRAGRKMGGK